MTLVTILLVLTLGLPLALTAIGYAAWRQPPPDPDMFAMPPGTTVRVLLLEWATTVVAWLAAPLRLRDERAAGSAIVVFVPEARVSSAVFWLLRRRLRRLGWSSSAVAGAATPAGLDAVMTALDTSLAGRGTDAGIVLVGHGLGGIAARRFAAIHPGRVRQIVTLGTPHQGSTAPSYNCLGAAAVARDAAAWSGSASPSVDVVSIFSDYDPWLEPLDNAYCPGGFNITVRGMGHFSMLWSARVAGLVFENLAAAAAPQTRPPARADRVPPCASNDHAH